MKTISGHEFPLIEVSGTPYELGYQHGVQVSSLVRGYLDWIEKLTGKTRDILCKNAMMFLPQIEALSPTLIEEIRGLAAGSDISLDEAMLCQVRAEASRIGEGGCTGFALKGHATLDGNPLAGQNQDLEPEYSDVAILLRVNPSDGRPRALMFTFAGQIGYSGLNEHGLCHFANALYGFKWQMGLPHYPIKRIMMEKRTTGECVELLRKYRTCSAHNVVICDRNGGIANVEIRPESIAQFEDDDSDWRIHTNHYVSEEFAKHEDGTLADSCDRFDRMRMLVKDHWGQITVDTIKMLLADHEGDPAGICRHGADDMHSISGYVAEPAKRILHVRRGHGCIGTWQSYEV